ncbi:hypothetical protein GIY30_01310 [Gordonia sp. HNM0687]|uniref:SnoaL-like domain-containing protein n=1 Tax=Gordonia mangrovi TaxID=2665643 RepID=A0A6L7GMI7_9ACTN|nr:nuclear transport factor 2 family protein [Gordonia mangrovi]MXP20005.1 hypothetical protein [Gordonia mangrovi]UVF79379.1 nuclear transport factor 2 family protein [Gordonia mangrovi]
MTISEREEREAVVKALFAAWSSGDLDAPAHYLSDTPVLEDSVGGRYEGWENIRAYFGHGLKRYPDLILEPTGEFWHRPDGLAMTWTMTATQTDTSLGEEYVGRRWSVPGMSYLVFDGEKVGYEMDYHDGGARLRSMQ